MVMGQCCGKGAKRSRQQGQVQPVQEPRRANSGGGNTGREGADGPQRGMSGRQSREAQSPERGLNGSVHSSGMGRARPLNPATPSRRGRGRRSSSVSSLQAQEEPAATVDVSKLKEHRGPPPRRVVIAAV